LNHLSEKLFFGSHCFFSCPCYPHSVTGVPVNIYTKCIKKYTTTAIAIFIIFTSFFLGSISRQLVTAAFTTMQVEHAEFLGKAVKMLIVSMGLLLGVAQIDVDVSFLTTVISISIAAALGAQSYMANILSST
jgi:hypothetical protein